MLRATVSAAEMVLYRLAAHGVDYIFINSGTDYPPLIEAVAKAQAVGRKIPELVTCPHESSAMGMAHGYYLATGKSQAVMLHTNVGLGNAASEIINAWNANIPTLVFGGRTPISEYGHFGCRNTPIGYGQEMRDQAALVREAVKWDFELRLADQIASHVDRAYAIANSLPRGPVYLSLPREPLCEAIETDDVYAPPPQAPVRYLPDRDSIAAAAKALAAAERPVIFAQRGARSPAGFRVLSRLANRWAIPVVEYWGTEVAISAEDPMAAGNQPQPWLREADAILVIDSLAPWMMIEGNPTPACKVMHVGPDPLFAKYPVRGYRADINLAGEVDEILEILFEVLESLRTEDSTKRVRERCQQVADRNARAKRERMDIVNAGSHGAITKPFFSHCLGQLAEKYDGKIVSELTTMPEYAGLTRPDSYYQEALSGGLGEGFPIALGLQLADRDRLVIAALGDGSYLFSNPAVCHHLAEMLRLPVLVVVGNNAAWGAVAGGTLALYPDGYAAKAKPMPAVSLAPTLDFGKLAEATRARGLSVDKAEDLPSVLQGAAAYVKENKCSALVEVKMV